MSAVQVVGAIIENEEGCVLLAQRPPGKHLAGFWEFPGGKVEPGESAPEALKRELQEELALDVAIGRFLGVFPHTYDSGAIDLHVYVVKALNEPKRSQAVQVFKWLRPGKIRVGDLAPADVEPYKAYLSVSGLSLE